MLGGFVEAPGLCILFGLQVEGLFEEQASDQGIWLDAESLRSHRGEFPDRRIVVVAKNLVQHELLRQGLRLRRRRIW